MTSISENRSRTRLANLIIAGFGFLIVCFWAYEFAAALDTHEKSAEELIARHERDQLEKKSEELRALFDNLYATSRTVSLLPMVRSVKGPNRRSEREDVVAQGRFSIDAHRSMQQIYINLHHTLKVSEIYLVLDGFDPARGDVPFFMYDDAVAGSHRGPNPTTQPDPEMPAEVEDFEYAQFPKQLDWFRRNAPRFEFSERMEAIPVRLSPLLQTCDNSQYRSPDEGEVRDTKGFIYAMPVYDLGSGALRGMVTTILRANVIEAWLLGIPHLPVTVADRFALLAAGVRVPEQAAPFYLRNDEYGISIFDRRNRTIADHLAGGAAGGGRWATVKLDLRTGGAWELGHHLSAAQVERLVASVSAARQATIVGRVVLLGVLVLLFVWGVWLMQRARRELTRMAQVDALTELPNRRAFFDRLESALARAGRNRGRIGLFFIDIAGFNAINDALGQQAGDRLLAAVADRLRTTVRSYDLVSHGGLEKRLPDAVSRLGGDEFTILCEDLKSADDLAIVAERVLEVCKAPYTLGHDEVEVALYVGVAAYPEDAADGEKLLMSAESAMQECRLSGPGYRLFNEEMRRRAARQHLLMIELQSALERGQFVLFYQPKQALASGCVVSFEALIRWRHPDFGLVSPAEFIPLLERSGRIIEVGEWVLRRACEDLAALSARSGPGLRVSVNVSVRQLRRGQFDRTVERVLADTGLDPDRLILELTESMVMENIDEGRSMLEKLAALGVRLAIDDFGTGYSSLTYLRHLPLDYLKLDKSFIDGMVDERARHIVRTVIVLAQGLRLETIAEGIEQPEQAAELAGMGCDMIQGYLLSKPLPLDEIADWLARRADAAVVS